MIKFIGEHAAKLDDKGRLVFPSAFKMLIDSADSKQFVVKRSLFTQCLEMYTLEQWEEESRSILSRLNINLKRSDNEFWRKYMKDSAIIEPDERVGRIMIPKKLLDMIGVEKHVVFCGNDFKIEIWAKDKYEADGMSDEDFITLAEKLLG